MSTRCTSLAECMKVSRAASRSKYRNVRTSYGDRTYDSAAEAAYAMELDLRQRAGDIRAWTPQPRIRLEIEGQLICTYVGDFEVVYPDGRRELIDVKGAPPTPVFKLKRRLLEVLRPDLTLRVVQR